MRQTNTTSEADGLPGQSTAMLLTGEGAGALATVRITGPLVSRFMATCCRARLSAGGMGHGRLMDGQTVLDDPVVFQEGEVAEFHLHGGEWVVHRVMDLVSRFGFKTKLPMSLPLPRQAVDANGRLEQEILQWLPLARTREAVASLLSQASLWRGLLADCSESQLAEAAGRRGLGWLLGVPRVAIIGVPNAGKSTLVNALLARMRVIASDVAGTTRDWVEEEVNLKGLPIHLVDTPGFRWGESVIEREAIRLAQPVAAGADLTLLLLDVSQPFDPLQASLVAQFPAALSIASKVDLPWLWQPRGMLQMSAREGTGLDLLAGKITSYFECETLPLTSPATWTSRQAEILRGPGSPATRIELLLGDAR